MTPSFIVLEDCERKQMDVKTESLYIVTKKKNTSDRKAFPYTNSAAEQQFFLSNAADLLDIIIDPIFILCQILEKTHET